MCYSPSIQQCLLASVCRIKPVELALSANLPCLSVQSLTYLVTNHCNEVRQPDLIRPSQGSHLHTECLSGSQTISATRYIYHITADSLSVENLNLCLCFANRHVTNTGQFFTSFQERKYKDLRTKLLCRAEQLPILVQFHLCKHAKQQLSVD